LTNQKARQLAGFSLFPGCRLHAGGHVARVRGRCIHVELRVGPEGIGRQRRDAGRFDGRGFEARR